MTDYNHDPLVPRVGQEADLASAIALVNEILWTSDTFRLFVEQGGVKKLVGEADFLKLTGGTLKQQTLGNEVLRLESVATNDDVNMATVQARVATADATTTTLATIPIPADTVVFAHIWVVARQTAGGAGTVGQGASYDIFGTFRNIGGTVTVINYWKTPSENDSTWDVVCTASGTDVLVQVTGKANETITWHATIMLQTVGS